jgi:hypothetical protein
LKIDNIDREFLRFKIFWDDIMRAIDKTTRSGEENESLVKSIYFMSGLLTAAAEILKTFNQEMYPDFTPELQEKIDKIMRIFVRAQAAGVLDKILKGK